MKNKQKYRAGDIVLVKPNTPWIYRDGVCIAYKTGHGEKALVLGSYADEFGGHDGSPIYSLDFARHGPVSWYDEDILTLVER